MLTTLSEKLKSLRQKKEWSLDDLAREAGASKSYLWELENRPERKPSAEKLTDIARVLGVTTEYLLDEKATFDDAQVKEVFFRKFNRLEDGDKTRIMDMIDTWTKRK
jgi:transcriptional regulator with XRE-family HTH domain